MTKLRWDKADRYDRDPGSIINVPDTTRPWTPPQDRKLRQAERAKEGRALRERSEKHDQDLLVDGLQAAIRKKEERGEPLSSWDKLIMMQRDKDR